jgi:hypothetical protein
MRTSAYRHAESVLRASAASDFPRRNFDIFLSHSYADAEVVLGVKRLLEAEHLTVYVDWIEDGQLDRTKVTVENAEQLRGRLQHSKSLIYVSSRASVTSRWMPWELGYFDGSSPGHVAILPLVASEGDDFVGQEYLSLYPYVESVPLAAGRVLGIPLSTSARLARLREFVDSGVVVVSR